MTSKQMDLTKNFFALGLMFWLYERSMEPDAPLDRREVLGAAGHRRGEQARAQGRLRLRRDDRDRSTRTTGSAPAKLAAGHLPQHHRQRGDGARLRGRVAAGRPAAVLRLATRSRRPSTSSTSSSGYKNFGVKTFQAEDEIAAIGAAIGAAYGGALGPDRVVRPGHRAQDARRWAWPSWSSCRSSSSTSSAPARRTGHADQDRAGGPAPGDVRAQLRLADAGRRAGHARRVLRHAPSRRGGSRSST